MASLATVTRYDKTLMQKDSKLLALHVTSIGDNGPAAPKLVKRQLVNGGQGEEKGNVLKVTMMMEGRVLNCHKSLKQNFATMFAVLKMGSPVIGVPGKLAQKHAPQEEVVLGNSDGQEHAHLPHVVASLVLLLTFCKNETAMVLILLLVRLTETGAIGAAGQIALQAKIHAVAKL